MRPASRPSGQRISTVIAFEDQAVWAPLERVARLARQSPQLPSFHEAEFMFMGTARDMNRGLAIHLYKHVDTRRYLNLDDAGQAYAYSEGGSMDDDNAISGGWYRLYVSLAAAIEHVGLSIFEVDPGFIRSFPPDQWPATAACEG